MLTARTLAEANIYLSVMAAADDAPDAAKPGPPETSLTEGQDAWTVHSDVGEVAVPYSSEDASRTIGARFGLGVSLLVDAGMWVRAAGVYARRALEADLAYTGQPGQDRHEVELNWEFAADAMAEALKFLPDGADELPEQAFWSEFGVRVHEESPELFTRPKLLDDLDYYRGTLEDFRSLYGPAD
jgi:hypothetical protein